MKRYLPAAAGVILFSVACTQPVVPGLDDPGDALAPVVASATVETQPPAGSTSSGGGSGSAPTSSTTTISGSVGSGADFKLYELGASNAGDRWIVSPSSATSGSLVFTLFDADMNLLNRAYSASEDVDHAMRATTGALKVGVAPSGGGQGGSFSLTVRRFTGGAAPQAKPQVVYLNFGAGESVRIHEHSAVSFSPFDAAMTGAPYAGKTAEMKAAIIAAMRADYARYNVTFVTSDEGQPSGAFTTVHFGGIDNSLLGLADDVDSYNSDDTENAIVFVESFSLYQNMGLTVDEMAFMLANVASHELGHLLGLYHTKAPDDLMDTTGTAWDLAEDQAFLRAELETSVFPTGMEDSPTLLEQTLGLSASATAKLVRPVRGPTHRLLREFTRQELRHTCGTCARLDR